MATYLVIIVCKLTHDVQIWSTYASSKADAVEKTIDTATSGWQRDMWTVLTDDFGKPMVQKVTTKTRCLAQYDY